MVKNTCQYTVGVKYDSLRNGKIIELAEHVKEISYSLKRTFFKLSAKHGNGIAGLKF